MALFGFGKKKENAAPCSCGCTCGKAGGAAMPEEGILVLGSGCSSCHQLYENVKAAAEKLGCAGQVEYVTDMARVASYNVMRMPALVVRGTVVSSGKVLKAEEAEELLRRSMEGCG